MSRPQLIARPSSRLTIDKTIVLVTGGNAGIGYEIVKALATTQPNFQVLMGCRDTAKGEAAVASMGAPLNVNPIQLDIQDDTSVDHCRKAIEQLFGRLDILINNAGTGGVNIRAQGIPHRSRKMWQHVLDVNLISTGYFTEVMIPLLEQSRLPKIIFISSRCGSIGSLASGEMGLIPQPWYNSSKSAINMLTVYYAKAHPRFKVNATCPGYRATASNDLQKDSETDPKHGAINVVRLANEGADGATATFSDKDGPIPW